MSIVNVKPLCINVFQKWGSSNVLMRPCSYNMCRHMGHLHEPLLAQMHGARTYSVEPHLEQTEKTPKRFDALKSYFGSPTTLCHMQYNPLSAF